MLYDSHNQPLALPKQHLLKPFSQNTVFSPNECREDKIDVMMKEWCINVADDRFDAFRSHLAAPPEEEEESAFCDENGWRVYGWLFCRPETVGKKKHGLDVRKTKVSGKKKSFGPPLFGGYIQFHRALSDGHPLYPGWRPASIKLSLNLQRYIRHQPKQKVPSVDSLTEPCRIAKRKDVCSIFAGEAAYDGEDNWIPDTPEWANFANSTASLTHLKNYLEKIARVVQREMRRALSNANQEKSIEVVRHKEQLSLSVVETAWEFRSESPLSDVVEIGNMLMNLRTHANVTSYGLPNQSKLVGLGSVKRHKESPAFHIPLAENVELRLYAKTNRRIRFEVVQMGLWKKWSELLREAGGKPGDRHASRTVDQFIKVIEALRVRAATHLNKLMKQLRATKAEGLLCRPVVDLLAEIAAAMPSSLDVQDRASLTREVLHLLCYQKGFRRTIANSELSPPFTTLKKRGVVRWDKRRRFYVLSPEFAPAADALEKLTGNPFTAFFGRSKDLRSFYRVGKRLFRDR